VGSYLLRRLLFSALALVGVMIIVFWLARLTGSPAALYLPDNATTEQVNSFNHAHGYDQPIVVQFWTFVAGASHLDFGNSLSYNEPAMQPVLQFVPTTLLLSLYAILLALVVAIPLGSIAAVYKFRLADRVITVFSLFCSALPGFWIALVGILIFAVNLHLLPTSGALDWRSWVLPVVTLSLKPIGVLTQVVRGAMADTLGAGFMIASRSRGFSPFRRVMIHGLRNASLPIITVSGDTVRHVLNGGIIVGVVFSFPSIGFLMVTAVENRDFAVLQAGVFLIGILIVALNFVIDLIYAYADPRVRLT
jgi:peptide/nickel transport system permease protein